jgi:NAD(P)-dependent dehydrogenase (short-subunit alcohol dehydrogenase family)
MDLGLKGKVAVVTGASRGLGRAIAEELAREGCALAICARGEDDLTKAAADLRGGGAEVFDRVLDVTDPAQVRSFIADAAGALGGIDILVNNAGRAHPGNFESLTDEDWQADIDVKLFSMIRCSREALPHMRARGGGRIVNINAVLGRSPDPAFFATSVNRAACISFTKALSLEVARDRILVNSVNIGLVRASQWERLRERIAPDLSMERFYEERGRDVPLGRFGDPEEVAAAVAFLVSDRAGYITGASVDVAGGLGRYL